MIGDTENTVYWLWLQNRLGAGARIADILRYFESARVFWAAGENAYRQCDCFGTLRSFSQKRLPLLLDKSLDDCREIQALCEKQHITVLTPDDPRYPARLRALRDLPAVLYVRGDPACLDAEKSFAVIGARAPTDYAKDAAAEISSVLAENGCTVVSGGAIGIDTVAHEGALKHQKPTVLVMGCGHGANYLHENAGLRKRVASCGALVTEYPPLQNPERGSFPLRNRLIAGLSDAVVIVQAGAGSGTLNTATHAVRQGKDLFVLPGSRDSLSFAGSNQLLLDGAHAVTHGADVLAYYDTVFSAKIALKELKRGEPFGDLFDLPPAKTKAEQPSKPAAQQHVRQTQSKQEIPASSGKEKIYNFVPENVSKNAQIVYNILQTQPCVLDELVRRSGLLVPQVLSSLTELELLGAVARDENAVYTCV